MTTYYIDRTGGDNRSAGTTPQRAWATLAPLREHLTSDDTVLLRRGEVWDIEGNATRLNIQSVHHVAVGSYGHGASPVLRGGPDVSAPVQVKGAHDITIADITVYGGYAQTLYVERVENIAISGIISRNSVMLFRYVAEVLIADCLIESGRYEGSPLYIGKFDEYNADERDILIRRCEIVGSERECIDLKPSCQGVHIENCTLLHARNSGVDVRGNDITIDYCEIYGIFGTEGVQGTGISGFAYGGRGAHWTFARNYIHDCAGWGVRTEPEALDVRVRDNVFVGIGRAEVEVLGDGDTGCNLDLGEYRGIND